MFSTRFQTNFWCSLRLDRTMAGMTVSPARRRQQPSIAENSVVAAVLFGGDQNWLQHAVLLYRASQFVDGCCVIALAAVARLRARIDAVNGEIGRSAGWRARSTWASSSRIDWASKRCWCGSRLRVVDPRRGLATSGGVLLDSDQNAVRNRLPVAAPQRVAQHVLALGHRWQDRVAELAGELLD